VRTTNNRLTARFKSVTDKAAVVIFNSVLVDLDDHAGRARTIERIDREHTLATG
jgi:hypothetical protein